MVTWLRAQSANQQASRLPQSGIRYRWVGVLLCIGAMLSQPLWAQSQDPLVARREAAGWLQKIQKAAQNQNYAGTMIYQREGALRSSNIAHYSDVLGNEYERVEMLDGKRQEILRHNDLVHNLIPDNQVVVIEHRDRHDAFPALLATPNTDLLDYYDFRRLATERVAGIECQLILLEAKDAQRYSYRLCADVATGLLLSAQTLSEQGKILEQVAFSQVQIGGHSEKRRILAAMGAHPRWEQLEIKTRTSKLEELGLDLAIPVKGFVKIREVSRPVGMPTSKSNAVASQDSTSRSSGFEVQQVVFSDGLSAVSIFIEPVSEKRHRKEGAMSRGATNVLVKRLGDYWITAVGEVPSATIKQFVLAVEPKITK